MESKAEEAVEAPVIGQRSAPWAAWRDLPRPQQSRVLGWSGYLVLLTLLFSQALTRLMLYAAGSDLHSHIVLVPFITGYLLYVHRRRLPVPYCSSIAGTVTAASVVTNLVLNARDAVGGRGHVHLRTEHLGTSVVLSVTDNGCGMSPAFVKESLFRPFQSTKKKGLGIGMFQSRMIVEAHGGSIRVESETGKGTTFRVSLPANGMK